MCLDNGEVVAANVADHIIPHRGDIYSFLYGELQSLCLSHHSGDKALQERGIKPKDYRTDIGEDGWPIDKKHPVYRKFKA